VPERKSSPHRLIIILALTLLSVVGAAVWVVGSERWEHIDPQDPGKMLAENVWREGSDRVRTRLARVFVRLRRSRSGARDAGESSERPSR
jgi:hypothetical protein